MTRTLDERLRDAILKKEQNDNFKKEKKNSNGDFPEPPNKNLDYPKRDKAKDDIVR